MPDPQLPHVWYGTVTNGTSRKVTILNETTNQKMETTTNSSGQFVFDLANFDNGYSNGDLIRTFVTYHSPVKYYADEDAWDDEGNDTVITPTNQKLNQGMCTFRVTVNA